MNQSDTSEHTDDQSQCHLIAAIKEKQQNNKVLTSRGKPSLKCILGEVIKHFKVLYLVLRFNW